MCECVCVCVCERARGDCALNKGGGREVLFPEKRGRRGIISLSVGDRARFSCWFEDCVCSTRNTAGACGDLRLFAELHRHGCVAPALGDVRPRACRQRQNEGKNTQKRRGTHKCAAPAQWKSKAWPFVYELRHKARYFDLLSLIQFSLVRVCVELFLDIMRAIPSFSSWGGRVGFEIPTVLLGFQTPCSDAVG